MSDIEGSVFNKSIFETRFRFNNDSISASKKKGVRCHNALATYILRMVRKPPIKLEVYIEGKKTFINVNKQSLIKWFQAHNQKLGGLSQWDKEMWQLKVEECLQTIESQKKTPAKKPTAEEPKKLSKVPEALENDMQKDAINTLAPDIEPKTIISEKNASESIPEDVLNIIVNQLPFKDQLTYTKTHKKKTASKKIASANLLNTGKIKDKDQIIRLACNAGESLKRLYLYDLNLTSEDLAAIATYCPNLSHLTLSKIDFRGLDVRFPPNLKQLCLKSVMGCNSVLIHAIPKSVERLLLITFFEDKDKEALQFLPENILDLNISRSNVYGDDLKHFSHLKKLEILNLSNCFLSDKGLTYLPKNIKELILGKCENITREGIKRLRFNVDCHVWFRENIYLPKSEE